MQRSNLSARPARNPSVRATVRRPAVRVACGDPNACKPEPICKPLETATSHYFLCTNRTWVEAAKSCAAVGMHLASDRTFAENERLRQLVPTEVWVGGNALETAGAWRWADDPSGSGEEFGSATTKGARWRTISPSGRRTLLARTAVSRWMARPAAGATTVATPRCRTSVSTRPPLAWANRLVWRWGPSPTRSFARRRIEHPGRTGGFDRSDGSRGQGRGDG